MAAERFEIINDRGGQGGVVLWILLVLILVLAGMIFAGGHDFGAHLQANKPLAAVSLVDQAPTALGAKHE